MSLLYKYRIERCFAATLLTVFKNMKQYCKPELGVTKLNNVGSKTICSILLTCFGTTLQQVVGFVLSINVTEGFSLDSILRNKVSAGEVSDKQIEGEVATNNIDIMIG